MRRKLVLAGGILIAVMSTASAWEQEENRPISSILGEAAIATSSHSEAAPSGNEITPEPPPSKSTPPSGFGGVGSVGGISGVGGIGSGGMGGPGYGASWNPARPVTGQNADLWLFRQSLSLGMPVWHEGVDTVLFSLGVRQTHTGTEAILPDTQRAFPSDLWSINLGANLIHRFENGWTGMLMVGFGSSSDQPFHSLDEMNGSIGAILSVPIRNDRDQWMFGVMYSPAGALNFPIPFLSYQWKPSEEFQMSIGLPLSLTWRPTEDWMVNLTYIPLTNVNAKINYRATESVSLYGGYEFFNESYFLVDRAEKKDRFMGFEQRLVGGVRWQVAKNSTLDFNAGYAFDRYFGEGQNQGSSLHDRVDIASGAFLGLAYRMGF
jgi:hypothetical protein